MVAPKMNNSLQPLYRATKTEMVRKVGDKIEVGEAIIRQRRIGQVEAG